MARRFRGLRYFLAPPWLTGKGDGEKIAYTLEAMLDVFTEKLRQGLEARFPSRAGLSALRLITGDRGLLRGRSETNAALAERLKAWRTPRTHAVRGNAYEALLQIWHYWGGIYAATVDAHGLRHEIAADDEPDADEMANPDTLAAWVDSGDTTWDDLDADTHWSRFWVILQPTAAHNVEPSPDFGDADLWGGALGTPGYTLGQTSVTPEDVSAMRALFAEFAWNGPSVPEWVVLVFDGDDVDGVEPDPEWKYWSKDDGSGTRIAARSSDYRYWSLSPQRNNTYSGDRSRPWPEAVTMVDGSVYVADRTNGAAWGAVTLPNGETYTGVRTRFPTRILLVDDGSVPK